MPPKRRRSAIEVGNINYAAIRRRRIARNRAKAKFRRAVNTAVRRIIRMRRLRRGAEAYWVPDNPLGYMYGRGAHSYYVHAGNYDRYRRKYQKKKK